MFELGSSIERLIETIEELMQILQGLKEWEEWFIIVIIVILIGYLRWILSHVVSILDVTSVVVPSVMLGGGKNELWFL